MSDNSIIKGFFLVKMAPVIINEKPKKAVQPEYLPSSTSITKIEIKNIIAPLLEIHALGFFVCLTNLT